MEENLHSKESLSYKSSSTQPAPGVLTLLRNDKAYRGRVTQSFLLSLSYFTLVGFSAAHFILLNVILFIHL